VKLIKPEFWKNHNFISLLLWPLTIITTLVNLIKKNKLKYKAKIPTICIGNIYLGGTGKTQLAIKINQILKKKYKIFLIKKKYNNQIDEQKLLRKYTNLILTENRVEGLKRIKRIEKSICLFDDGLQDQSIKYDLSIVCFSSVSGVGNGMVLPSGPLRESLRELKNYDAVFINGIKNYSLIKNIRSFNKKINVFSGKYYLQNIKKFNLKLNYLAFCGIGTPENFFNLLSENKFNVKQKIIFPDHYTYDFNDINKLKNLAKKDNLKLITTEKDFMKLKKFRNFHAQHTNVDFRIDDFSNFKKYIFKAI